MRALQILGVHRLGDAIVQIQPLGQFRPRHGLEALKDKVRRYSAAGNALIAVLAVPCGEDAVGLDRPPERGIVERAKPFFYIINVFKNHHATSVPEPDSPTQIWEALQ